MTGFARTTRFAGIIAALGLLFCLPASAQTSVQVTASWDPPTTGSPVVHYVLQLSVDGGQTYGTVATVEDTSVQLELEIGQTYIARVAGVDSQDRQGPWSLPSDPYTPDIVPGPPGQPGQPMIL